MMPEAYLATYVPVIPIANPISAFFKAGASFVPSPVIATTWLSCFKPVAIRYLSLGEDLANTFSCAETFLKFYIFPTVYLSSYLALTNPPTKALKSCPVITV
jgi:hypothetical protein